MLDALPPPCQPTEAALQEARRQLAALQPTVSVGPPMRPTCDSAVQHPATGSVSEVSADAMLARKWTECSATSVFSALPYIRCLVDCAAYWSQSPNSTSWPPLSIVSGWLQQMSG